MNKLRLNNLSKGMHVWCADYKYTSNGTKCTLNIEPTEHIITETSNSIKAKKINSKKKDSYLPTNMIFSTKKDAEAHYSECVRMHVKHLLSRVSYFSTIGVMSKRLNKYGMAELDKDLKGISIMAENITKKIDDVR